MSAHRRMSSLRSLYMGALVMFMTFPIVVIMIISFSDDRFMQFPPSGFGVRWYRAYLLDPLWLDPTIRSLRIGVLASALAVVTGTMLAIWLDRTRRGLAAVISAVAMAPAIVPHVLTALGIFLVVLYLRLTDLEVVVVAAHAMLGLPFVVLIVGGALTHVDPALERAARILGAGPVGAFATGVLPSLWPSIAASAMFAFFVSFDELLIALFVMGRNATLPVRIWTDLQFELNPTVAAVSALFIVVTTAGMTAAYLLQSSTDDRSQS